MKIYTPSYNRYDENLAITLFHWPKAMEINVVVRPKEVKQYEELIKTFKLKKVNIIPIGKPGVKNTRNAILAHANSIGETHIVIMDDDICLLIRRDDHEWKLRGATDAEIKKIFKEIDKDLKKYAHIGISGREGNNYELADSTENGRIMRFVALDLAVLNQHKLVYRLENREDFDLNLRLLSLGYANKVYFKYAQGQRESGMKGGLYGSKIREPEEMRANAHKLAALHPGLVKVVTKETKTSFGGGERTDVVCFWKRAYEQGISTRKISTKNI